MIIRARSIVTMDGAPIANGAVAVEGNKISEVGKCKSSGDVIDLGECALLPGLINAHCHLDYTCLRGKIARQKSFTDWIRAINAEKAKLSADDYVRSINDGFAEALRYGTTSIANLTGFPKLVAQVHAPIRTWWFAELIDIREPQVTEQGGMGLAPHAPYTASPNLYRRCVEVAEGDDLLLTTHVAEAREEMQMSLHGDGALAEFLRAISSDLFEAQGITPIAHLAEICRLDQRWLLVHVNEILESDLELLGKTHIAHCPRSHAYFGHTPFEFKKLTESGANICLGTDSLASNDDLSLFGEMRQFRKTDSSLSAREVLELVTINPARALRRANALGTIRAGHLADLIAVPFHGSDENVWDEIVAFEGEVPWKMIDGAVS